MCLPADAISEASVLRLVQRVRRIGLREAGENVVDLLREREARVAREEMRRAADHDAGRPPPTRPGPSG